MHSDKKLLLGNLSPKLMTIRKSETDERVAKIWEVNTVSIKCRLQTGYKMQTADCRLQTADWV